MRKVAKKKDACTIVLLLYMRLCPDTCRPVESASRDSSFWRRFELKRSLSGRRNKGWIMANSRNTTAMHSGFEPCAFSVQYNGVIMRARGILRHQDQYVRDVCGS
jgi:hypothetical protein